MYKNTTCGECRASDAGKTVVLAGWVHRFRDHGGVYFIDLRDRSGLTQVVINPEKSAEFAKLVADVRVEWVLQVTGVVEKRPAEAANPNLPTGEIEVHATEVNVLNTCKPLPFSINKDENTDEAIRLKYRFLDLRRERLQNNLRLRHQVIKFIRDYLDTRGFYEIETPILFKTTPEGARDYLVPSRVYPGQFYALPQSPQQLKQLLQVAGIHATGRPCGPAASLPGTGLGPRGLIGFVRLVIGRCCVVHVAHLRHSPGCSPSSST